MRLICILYLCNSNNRPEAIELTDGDGNTALHLALKACNRRAETVVAVLEAWPDAVKEKNNAGDIPLKLAFKLRGLKNCMYYHHPDADTDDAVANDTEIQLAMLAKWPNAAMELDRQGNSMVRSALHTHTHEAVVLALLESWPDAAKIVDSYSCTLLEIAIKLNAPVAIVRAIIKATPRGEGKKKLKISHYGAHYNNRPYGGGTLFHSLADNNGNEGQVTLLLQRLKNDVCFVLAAAGTSITDVDVDGRTAAADHLRTTEDPRMLFEVYGTSKLKDELINHHLLASFHEVINFQASPHLSMMHLRDWTTVSHAWCTPSAKLTALTVLLVGETYKRQLLPRLPMDCWYKILNMIPRHELRLGGCSKAEEDGMLKQYNTILGAAAEAKRKSTSRTMKGHNLRGRHL